eukprot:1096259-Prymnesium_polylepis.1
MKEERATTHLRVFLSSPTHTPPDAGHPSIAPRSSNRPRFAPKSPPHSRRTASPRVSRWSRTRRVATVRWRCATGGMRGTRWRRPRAR